MANDSVDIQFPEGRLIMGSLYKGSDKDSKGQPRVVKTGPNKGQPFTQFFAGVAIPKRGEQHWSQTEWGQKVLQVGAAAFPGFYQNPAFAWKIEDGDSAVPNKAGRRPCDSEGARGHWIVKFSSGFAPKIYQQPTPGTFVELTTPDAVKTGYWVVMYGNVASNKSSESPGVYMNSSMVLFTRTDAVIQQGPDAAAAFAGAAVSQALPGVAAVPFQASPPAMPAMPGVMPQPALAAAPAPVAMPVAVQPNPGFLALPGAPAAPALPALGAAPGVPMAPGMPPAPGMPAAPAAPTMTPAGIATGYTYEQYRTHGWTDDQLRAKGFIF